MIQQKNSVLTFKLLFLLFIYVFILVVMYLVPAQDKPILQFLTELVEKPEPSIMHIIILQDASKLFRYAIVVQIYSC